MKSLLLILLLPALAFSAKKYVSTTGSGTHDGSSSNRWTIAEALVGVSPGDTVYLATGTVYVDSLWLTVSGSAANPIVWKAEDAGVCSLRQTGPILRFDYETSYNVVEDIRFQTLSDHCMIIDSAANFNVVQRCRLWGGSNHNGNGMYEASFVKSASYNRILQCYFNPGAPDTLGNELEAEAYNYLSDALTIGDNGLVTGGPLVYHAQVPSNFNTVEQCTVTAFSHMGIAEAYALGQRSNIIRNNYVYFGHSGIGNDRAGSLSLYEGNRSFWNARCFTYAGGTPLQISGDSNAYRFNYIYNDTSDWGDEVNSDNNTLFGFVALVSQMYASPVANRFYRNTISGVSEDPDKMDMIIMQRDDSIAEVSVTNQNYMYDNDFISNILYKPDSGYIIYAYDSTRGWSDLQDNFRGNILTLSLNSSDTVLHGIYDNPYDERYKKASNIETDLATWEENIFASPLFTDSVSQGHARNFAFGTNSPAYNAGLAPATITFSTSSKDTVTVSDCLFFHGSPAAMTWERGDSILIRNGSEVARVEIDSIYYPENRLYLTSAISTTAGDSVHILRTWNGVSQTYTLRLSGGQPDIGAYEAPASSLKYLRGIRK